MKKKSTKIIIICIIAAVVLAATAFAGITLLKNKKGDVKVFSLNDIAMSDYWGDTSETDGMVETRNMQSVYVSDTQTVTEVFVEEGQQVKKGDKLASFDTTLTDISLERQRITLEKTQLDLENAKKELKKINGYVPYVEPAPQPEPEKEELPAQTLPRFLGGDGTEEHPMIYMWNDECWYTGSFINSFLPKNPEPIIDPEDPENPEEPEVPEEPETPEEPELPEDQPDGEEAEEDPVTELPKSWVVFEKHDFDNEKGDVFDYWGIVFTREEDGSYSFAMFEPSPDYAGGDTPVDPGIEPYYPSGPQYTASEIAQMKAEKQKEITDLELQVKVEQVKYDKLQLEMSSGVITAEIDGVVKTLADQDESRANGTPFMVVSGGGGYYIQGSLSELELESIRVGQHVTVISWMNYNEIDAEIVEISEYPNTNGYNWTNGNPNVSYYPFTVFVNEDAALQVDEYVSIRYSAAENSSGIYLEKPFVLSEGSKSFVYVKDENGQLEKREVATGRYLWGSYVEILDGLTMDDYVAFPYGKTVKDGANAIESTIDELYNEMYY